MSEVPSAQSMIWLSGLDPALSEHGPDFLVIAPPKTGTTWLACNLDCHPEIYVHPAKEVRFFGTQRGTLDFNWYLRQFLPGRDKVKGEASPSYAVLPLNAIRTVRALLPNVKLIYLMRDPIERAWSHAKHCAYWGEDSFKDKTVNTDTATVPMYLAHLMASRSRIYSDYLGALRRWLSSFPKEQMFVGFYETIAGDPEGLLRSLFKFLGVQTDVDFARFRVVQRLNVGNQRRMPAKIRTYLRRAYREPTRRLARFLKKELGLEVPPQWSATLHGKVSSRLRPSPPTDGERLSDDARARVLASEQLVGWPVLLEEGFLGFNIVQYRGRIYALAQDLGSVDLTAETPERLEEYQKRDKCFIVDSVTEATAKLLDVKLDALAAAAEGLPSRQDALEKRMDAALAEMNAAVTEVSGFMQRLRRNFILRAGWWLIKIFRKGHQ